MITHANNIYSTKIRNSVLQSSRELLIFQINTVRCTSAGYSIIFLTQFYFKLSSIIAIILYKIYKHSLVKQKTLIKFSTNSSGPQVIAYSICCHGRFP